jgi:hypothetical protein
MGLGLRRVAIIVVLVRIRTEHRVDVTLSLFVVLALIHYFLSFNDYYQRSLL